MENKRLDLVTNQTVERAGSGTSTHFMFILWLSSQMERSHHGDSAENPVLRSAGSFISE